MNRIITHCFYICILQKEPFNHSFSKALHHRRQNNNTESRSYFIFNQTEASWIPSALVKKACHHIEVDLIAITLTI